MADGLIERDLQGLEDAHPAVRGFLRINTWEGVDYVHAESWQELLAWMDRLERLLAPRDERVTRPVKLSVLERTLLDAANTSGYRVDRLRDALAGKRPAESKAGASSGKARLPNASGLPKGPKPRRSKPPGAR